MLLPSLVLWRAVRNNFWFVFLLVVLPSAKIVFLTNLTPSTAPSCSFVGWSAFCTVSPFSKVLNYEVTQLVYVYRDDKRPDFQLLKVLFFFFEKEKLLRAVINAHICCQILLFFSVQSHLPIWEEAFSPYRPNWQKHAACQSSETKTLYCHGQRYFIHTSK